MLGPDVYQYTLYVRTHVDFAATEYCCCVLGPELTHCHRPGPALSLHWQATRDARLVGSLALQLIDRKRIEALLAATLQRPASRPGAGGGW
jgi:hypothetical protein